MDAAGEVVPQAYQAAATVPGQQGRAHISVLGPGHWSDAPRARGTQALDCAPGTGRREHPRRPGSPDSVISVRAGAMASPTPGALVTGWSDPGAPKRPAVLSEVLKAPMVLPVARAPRSLAWTLDSHHPIPSAPHRLIFAVVAAFPEASGSLKTQ